MDPETIEVVHQAWIAPVVINAYIYFLINWAKLTC